MNRNLSGTGVKRQSGSDPVEPTGILPVDFGARLKRTVTVVTILLCSLSFEASLAQKISLVGGTIINPADGKTIENAVVVINGDKIESVASRKESGVPVGSRWVECDKQFI